jgi:hypothetical protein
MPLLRSKTFGPSLRRAFFYLVPVINLASPRYRMSQRSAWLEASHFGQVASSAPKSVMPKSRPKRAMRQTRAYLPRRSQ